MIVTGGAFTARINTTLTTQLLVLQIPDLCDPRVNVACLENITGDPIDDDGTLHLKPLLPASFQDALTVDITIPGYMFSSRHDGQFGVVFIQPDHVSDDAGASIVLEIAELADYELGVDEAPQLPRLSYADPTRVLNQDVAAYAPDNPLWDTVRDFEATPITTGSGSMEADMRGFSAVFYSLVHDVWEPIAGQTSQRANPVGIQTLRLGGLTPGVGDSCNLDLPGSQQFYHPDEEDVDKYFLNLIACLFTDEETLLRDVIPGNYPALETSLNQVKDKLIKALSGAGPNTGSETFSALLSQLDQFDASVRATAFTGLEIYKNELLVRSKVLRFNVVHRAIPSIPIGGF